MKKQKIKKETNFLKTLKFTAVIITSIFVIFTAAKAGNITPPSGNPTSQFYTLTEIYQFITNNTEATEGGHGFSFSDNMGGTRRTLAEIYNALASLISADQVKLGTTYLNKAGTLVPSSGDATTADVLTGKTFFGDSQANWDLQTGIMTNVGAQTITPSTSNQTITQGYHSGSGYCAGDANLISANIKSGITIFGIDGNGNVVDTSTGTVANNNQIRSSYICFSDGTQYTGSIADCNDGESSCYVDSGKRYANECGESTTSTQTDCYVDTTARYLSTSLCDSAKENQCFIPTDNNYYAFGAECSDSTDSTQTNCYVDDTAKYVNSNVCSAATSTGYCFMNTATFPAMDADLVSENIRSTVEIFGVSGNSNVVNTSTGDAVAGDVTSGKIVWVDGVEITGNILTQTLSASNQTVNAGYYNATTLSAVDSDLATGNIKLGTTIFGFLGTYEGEGGGGLPDTGQTTSYGTAADDADYTSSNSGTCDMSFTDNGDETITDNCTNLMWKKCSEGLSGLDCATGSASTYNWEDAKAQCEGLTFAGYSNWRLPNAKELQSIINYENYNPAINATYFPATVFNYYWASTTYKITTSSAWRVSFSTGAVRYTAKTTLYYVRCVRG